MLISRRMLTPTTRRLSRIALAGLAVCSLALAACAGGGSENAARKATADGRLPFRMISTSPSFTDLPTSVILARNYFEKVGLDATFDFGASNASLITQAIISGNADVGSSGTGAVYNAYAEGRTDLVILGTTNRSITFGLALNKATIDDLAKKGVTPASPAKDRVQALRGLNIAASPQGSTGNAYLRIMLSEYGLDPDDDVRIVPNNDATAQISATRRGRTDGFASSFPRTNFPKVQGWGDLWLNWAEDLPSLLPLASHSYYTTRSWLKENPEVAKRVMEALWLAHQDLQNPTQELKDAVKALPDFKDVNQDAFDAGWELAIDAYQGVTPLTTQEMFDKAVFLVNSDRKTPVKLGFEDIYDLSAAEAAQP
jgi:NitT/TauT family transport system substrate-binding protein